jgi:hypothetical protein
MTFKKLDVRKAVGSKVISEELGIDEFDTVNIWQKHYVDTMRPSKVLRDRALHIALSFG